MNDFGSTFRESLDESVCHVQIWLIISVNHTDNLDDSVSTKAFGLAKSTNLLDRVFLYLQRLQALDPCFFVFSIANHRDTNSWERFDGRNIT